ncbi:type IV pilus modification PilV family protein [Phascolarctobacterium sp.]
MKGIPQFRKNKQGFLLVDSIVGVLLLAIGLTALAMLYMQGTGVSVKSDKMQAAVQVAGQEMERLKKADGKSLNEAQNIIELINTVNGSSNINYDDDKYVAMRGYTPDKGSGSVAAKDRFEITTTLTTTPIGSTESGKLSNYPVSVQVTWYDPQKSSYTVYGFVLVKND